MPTSRIIAAGNDGSATETSGHFPMGALEKLSREELLEALRLICSMLDIDRGVAKQSHPAQRKYRLSSREYMVLMWVKEGKTNWEISQILQLSERTVRFHVARIFEKLEVTSRAQAVARAIGAGLIAC